MRPLILVLLFFQIPQLAGAFVQPPDPSGGDTTGPDNNSDGPGADTPELLQEIILGFADCPKELVGQFGGMYHYVTETCPANGDEAFSQSTIELEVPQCGIITPDVCGEENQAAAPAPRITAQTLAEAKQLVDDGLTDLASFKTKYANVRTKRKSYIEGLLSYRNEWKAKLAAGGTLEDFNQNYDPDGRILAADKNARAIWGRFGPSSGESPWAPVLSDEKVQQDSTPEALQPGWQLQSAFYVEIPNDGEPIFFRWLDLNKGGKHSYVAFQVDQIPAGEQKRAATFADKNSYQHLLVLQGESTPFFATTFDDLTP